MRTFLELGIDVAPHATGEHRVTCPECSPTRQKKNDRCLAVNSDKGVWVCHHCGWSGNLDQKEHGEGWPMPEVQRAVSQPIVTECETKFIKISGELSDKAINWLRGRGLTEEVLKRNQIGSSQRHMAAAGKVVNVIEFPYFVNGKVVNVKYRDANKNFCMVKGAPRVLYKYDDFVAQHEPRSSDPRKVQSEELIITEGEIDALSCEVAGFRNAVSVPNGAPAPNAKLFNVNFSFLQDLGAEFTQVKRFVLATDNDDPGRLLRNELARRLGVEKCFYVEWPDNLKDANEVLQKHGPEVLGRCLKNAKPFPIQGVYTLRDIAESTRIYIESGAGKGVSTGWKELDQYYLVAPGELSIVTGIPSSGKSEFLDALMINLVREQDWGFGICSAENLPIERHAARLSEKVTKKRLHPGVLMSPETRQSFDAFMTYYGSKVHFIALDASQQRQGLLSINSILDIARALVLRHGIRGLIIDPWNELEHERPKEANESEYIGLALGTIRQFARRSGVHVWIVAHPKKLEKDKEGGYSVPTPYDISGSANWRNKADVCLAIERDMGGEGASTTTVYIQKVRFKDTGKIGNVSFSYDLNSGCYSAYGGPSNGQKRTGKEQRAASNWNG